MLKLYDSKVDIVTLRGNIKETTFCLISTHYVETSVFL